MGWFGNWFGTWLGRWFGTVQQQPGQYTTARRFGRILKQGDILFADGQFPSIISTGAVILSRQGTDDYVRFRVPDTQCPPLPQPDQPLDSAVADEAEPARWLVVNGNPNTGNKWLLRAQEQDTGNDEIRLSYTVFPADFHIEFCVELVWSGGSYGYGNGHGVGVEVWKDGSNYIRAGAGRFWTGALVGMWSGRINGAPLFYEVAYIASNALLYVQLARVNDAVSIRFSDDGSTWAAWRTLGSLPGELRLSVRGFMVSLYGQPAGSAYADCRFHYCTTLSGAPSSVTVATPVVDTGVSTQAQVRRYPENLGTLEWRANNTPFAPEDNSPAWGNPTGAYRYWQARVTWTDPTQLLERIELLTDAQRIMLFRRFRDYWTIWDASEGKTLKTTEDKAVFGSGTQVRTDEGWQHNSDEERVTTVR